MAERDISQMYSEVMAHQRQHGNAHGINCICMDPYIREIRNILKATKPDLRDAAERYRNNLDRYLESDEYKGLQRWRYIVRTVAEGM